LYARRYHNAESWKVPKQTLSDDTPIDSRIAACLAQCADTLSADYPGVAEIVGPALGTPHACFDLLSALPESPEAMATLRQAECRLHEAGLVTPFWAERFVVLQGCLEALPRLAPLPVDESVKAQFCAMCRHLAGPVHTRDTRLAMQSDAFAELAKLLTHRRFHAGQLSFDIMDMPRAWLLKVHPIALPGLLHELHAGFGGLGPVVIPHINYWRPNPLFVTLREQERSLQRIARSMAADSRIKGFISSSWVYGAAVGDVTPHLAWLRDFFAANNAYIADAGPALEDAGFLLGSEKRRVLHAEGQFAPRETLVLWRRQAMLEWAARGELSALNVAPNRPQPRGPGALRPQFQSGHVTVLDCRRMLYYKPRRYIAIVLAAPALAASLLSAAIWGLGAVLPALLATLAAMWLAQYFFLQ
jgi:hypothetical protein